MGKISVVHYINQFFGGIGGEEHANEPVQVSDGPVGPGRALQQALGADAEITATIIAGDNYFVEEVGLASKAALEALRRHAPQVIVAGPAFDAGRYGLACAQMCRLAQDAGIPAVTAMTSDNTGVITYGADIVAVPSGSSPAEMQSIMAKLAGIAVKMGSGGELGPADGEGYLPRGIRKPLVREKSGAIRAVDMMEARLMGDSFTSEVFIKQYDVVQPSDALGSLKEKTIALVTSGGMVPRGNPDRLSNARAEGAFRYDIEGVRELTVEGWESVHGGFNTRWLNTKDPGYALPLRAVRELEEEGAIGKIHNTYYATTGNQTAVTAAKRMGGEIGRELLNQHVDAVLLVAT